MESIAMFALETNVGEFDVEYCNWIDSLHRVIKIHNTSCSCDIVKYLYFAAIESCYSVKGWSVDLLKLSSKLERVMFEVLCGQRYHYDIT
jgi:hypothetical protein